MSQRVYEAAREVLSPLFSIVQKDQNYQLQKQQDWNGIRTELEARIGKGKVGKARDVEMIICALQFTDAIPSKNIVAYSVAQIRAGRLQQHYNQMQAQVTTGGITQVGPKIAAFYLRDVVSLFQLTASVDDASTFCLQGVDTWVQKVAVRLGIVQENAAFTAIQKAIVKMCDERKISALRFNQGAWFIGYHAFDLVLDLLSK